MNEVLVLAEHRQGVLREITLEMVGMAKSPAVGGRVSVLLLGQGVAKLALGLGAADRVLLAEGDGLASYDGEMYLRVAEEVIRERKPRLVLLGHTATGMDLAPALATRLGLPLVTDCLKVELNERLLAERRVYGGKVVELLEMKPATAYVATIRPGSHPPAEFGRGGEIQKVELADSRELRARRFVRLVEAELADIDIADAEFLVSVGRGVGKPENMETIKAFAEAIGATLSCSRPVADKGWLPKSRQVGTSGKVVRPRVYLALGISGAYQHAAGMRGSETIIAVNTDPAAPIFDVAHYGLVADMFGVLPALQKALQAR